jgi:SAM-dependent methyltransferase
VQVTSDGYLLPNRHEAAVRRLDQIAGLYDRWTFHHIDALGIAPSWRCWEIGAGGPSVARGLAARAGHVLATDIDTSLVTDVPATVEVRTHDIARDAPPEGGFDLVHARLVLVHVPERVRALQTIVAALRPGGWLLIEDADPGLQPLACIDERGEAGQRANRIRRGVRALVAARGADLELGRKLPRLLREAGLVEVRSDAYLVLEDPACSPLELATIVMLRDQLVAAGHATAAELDDHVAAVTAGTVLLSQPPLVSAWGKKPLTP